MSIYMAAAGMAAELISGAAADAVYDATFNKSMSMFDAGNRKAAVEDQMANVRQEQVLGVANIHLAQDAAEAQAKINAAAKGVSGGSVEQLIYDTNKDAAFATANINAQADADVNALSKSVQTADIALSSAQNIDADGASFGQTFAGNTLKLGGSYLAMDKKGKDNFNKLWSD